MRKRIFRAWARNCLAEPGWGFFLNAPGKTNGDEYYRTRDFWTSCDDDVPSASGSEKALFLLFISEAEEAQ